MLQAVRRMLRSRYQDWINRRLPAVRTITLNQSRIFIFPSAAGIYFLLVLLVMLLAAINYQNNMVFALVFLLASAFVVTILHTYANFSGLSITAVRAFPSFVGDEVRFDIKVSSSGKRKYYDITLSWPDSEVCNVTLDQHPEVTVALHLPARQRGLLIPPRLKVETVYPLGIMRCWTWLALDVEAIVYPKPLAGEFQSADAGDGEEGSVIPIAGNDEFYAFRNYQPGDALKHIAWKNFAKGQPLQTKQFASYRDRHHWIDWDSFSGDIETRLSTMCYWVLKLEKQQEEYGLRLPGVAIDTSSGEVHQARILRELAVFNASSGGIGGIGGIGGDCSGAGN